MSLTGAVFCRTQMHVACLILFFRVVRIVYQYIELDFSSFRFLQNWRTRDDDADNIILQLEQPESTNGQWPPRISFT